MRSNATGSDVKKRKHVMTLKEKVELLDILCRTWLVVAVGHHFGINKSTLHFIKKEEQIPDAVLAAASTGAKKLHYG